MSGGFRRIKPAAAALMALVAFLAAHGTRAAVEEGTMRVGKVQVVPVLSFDLGYTSNLYLESTTPPDCSPSVVIDPHAVDSEQPSSTDFNPDSSMVTSVTAGLRFLLPGRDLTFGAGGYGVWHWYAEDENQNSDDWKIFASVSGDYPGGLAFTLKDTYEWGWLLESFEFGEGEDYTLNELNLDAHYTFHDEMRVRFQWVNFLYDYDISNNRDRTENVLTGTVYRRIAAKTAALVALDYADYDYDINPLANNHSIQLSGGLTWEATDRGTAILQGGYEWKRYDEEIDRDGDGVAEDNLDGQYYTFGVAVRYLFGRRLNTFLDLHRRSVESDFQDNPYFVRSSLKGGAGYRFLQRFTIGGSAEVEFDGYPNETTICNETLTRDDTTGILRGRLGFDLHRSLRLAVEVEYESRDSNFDIYDYDDTRFFFTIDGGVSLDWLKPRRR